MKKISKPIVFFGSGPVAAKSLELLAADFTIEAVITKPRPAHHKGEVPVLTAAKKLDLPVKTVASKQELDDLLAAKPFTSNLGILIDFGIIVSKTAINYFSLGIINSHFSLLPEWRGADPITFAVLSGQRQTGVSLMLLVEAMDEGPLLAQSQYELDENITTPQLTTALIDLSYQMLKVIVPLYVEGSALPVSQETVSIAPSKIASYSRRLSKEDAVIDWQKPAEQLEREIRAFAEWPKSKTFFGTLQVIITKARVVRQQGGPGHRTIEAKWPMVFCGKDALLLERLKPAGKQEMTGEAFLAGYKSQFLG